MIQSGLYGDIQKCKIKYYTITNRKGRYGESDKAIGLVFYGSVGAFKELPPPNQINDYEKFKNINYYFDKEIDKEIEIKAKPGYKFEMYPD